MSGMKAVDIMCVVNINTAVLIAMSPEQSRAILVGVADLIDVCREADRLQRSTFQAGSAQEGGQP